MAKPKFKKKNCVEGLHFFFFVDASRFISNKAFRGNLAFKDEIKRLSINQLNKLNSHNNLLAIMVLANANELRRRKSKYELN